MIKRILLLLLTITVSGCHGMVPKSLQPGSWILKQVPKEGSPYYRQGWIDGCKSGMGSMTNSTYRSFYRHTMDPKLRRNAEYYRTWKDTFTFCRHYAYGVIRETDTRMRLPNQKRSFHERIMGGHNIIDHMLNLGGPGYQALPWKHFGNVFKHNGASIDTMGGTLNYCSDMILSGCRNPIGSGGVLDLSR